MSLSRYLSQIADFRRGQGQRYNLVSLLTLITLGVMSGYYGYRELAAFMKANEAELKAQLKLKWRRMPSHVTIRTVMRNVPSEELTSVFSQWAQEQGYDVGEAIAIDGKCLGSTVKQAHDTEQNFVQIVSAFAHQRQVVLGKTSFQNGKQGEGQAVRDLLEHLELVGAIFTLDALHCQKNAQTD